MSQGTNDQRITWIASYPKSGNTWVRALLAAWLTGGPVNVNAWPRPVAAMDLWPSHYQSVSPRPITQLAPSAVLGLRGAALQHLLCNPDPIYCKTHMTRLTANQVDLIPDWITKAAVYVVRNPYDVAVSLSHHMECSVDEAIDFMTSDTAALSKHGGGGLFHVLGRWDAHVESWIDAPSAPVVLRYEDLSMRPVSVFMDFLAALGIEADRARVGEAVEHASFERLAAIEAREDFQERRCGVFFRRGKVGWGDALDFAQRKRIAQAFGDTIDRLYSDER